MPNEGEDGDFENFVQAILPINLRLLLNISLGRQLMNIRCLLHTPIDKDTRQTQMIYYRCLARI
jgi:hypothetical protein